MAMSSTVPRSIRRFALVALLLVSVSVFAAQSRIERIRVDAPSLAGNLEGDPAFRQAAVYLPAGYDEDAQRRYPVLYVLHGFGRSDAGWFGLAGETFIVLPRALDAATAAGARTMIVVVPNAYTRFAGSMYSTSPTTGDWESFITKDLVAWMDSHYRTLPAPESRGLAGHSMGGYGALRIAMKHPDVFSALYVLSACCLSANLDPNPASIERAAGVKSLDEADDADIGVKVVLAEAAAWSPNPSRPPLFLDLPVEQGKVRPDVVAAWAANAPLAMVRQYVPNLMRFDAVAMDVGDMDKGIKEGMLELSRLLDELGVDHDIQVYPGDHHSGIEQRFVEKVVPFFSVHLTFEP
jgi:S-formylglutathione hydrolase FrmB